MKRFIRKKSVHSILEIIGVFAIFAALFLVIWFLRGYRFVYPEQFSNDWNAISSVGTWAGVVASFVAVWYAVRVADEQNKISLFEKRYDCYLMVQNLLLCGERLKDLNRNNVTFTVLEVYFQKAIGSDELINSIELMRMTFEIDEKLAAGVFLFSNYDMDLLHKIIEIGGKLGTATYKGDSEEGKEELSTRAAELKNKYCELCDKFKATCFKDMEEELDLV